MRCLMVLESVSSILVSISFLTSGFSFIPKLPLPVLRTHSTAIYARPTLLACWYPLA